MDLKPFFAFALLMLALLLFANDRHDHWIQLKAYCDGVDLWLADAARGLPPEQRLGHPDYDRIYHQECGTGAGNE